VDSVLRDDTKVAVDVVFKTTLPGTFNVQITTIEPKECSIPISSLPVSLHPYHHVQIYCKPQGLPPGSSLVVGTNIGMVSVVLVETQHDPPIAKTTCTANPLEIVVLSVDHSSGTNGKYFNFNVKDVNQALQDQGYDHGLLPHEVIMIKQLRTGACALAILWPSPNGGSVGDGHGRWAKGATSFQWSPNDKIELVLPKACPTVKQCRVHSTNHAENKPGIFFNMWVNRVKSVVSTPLKNTNIFTAHNLRTGKKGNIVFWTAKNGGSTDGHGRWETDWTSEYEWATGDCVEIAT